jgi:hypothetical protein
MREIKWKVITPAGVFFTTDLYDMKMYRDVYKFLVVRVENDNDKEDDDNG